MQTFVDGQLPQDDNEILTTVSKKGFEVEGFEKTQDGDSLFEIKVLPNRIADALSVRGMARELAAVFNLKWGGNLPLPSLSDYKLNNEHLIQKGGEEPLYIFTGVKVSNFDNTIETPEWIKDIIVKSGGRSINCLVDITNLMLFSFGQPAHVFDFEKMSGKVVTRYATAGEELELLDGKKVKLSETDFVIADEARALSLAGIKGGKFAETTKETKVALFEMANFNPTMIRKTSTSLGIRTDASKIFENGITTNKTEEALQILLISINEIAPNAVVEFIINQKNVDKSPTWVETTFTQIKNYAGKEIPNTEIVRLLKAQNFELEETGEILKVKATGERLDVNISEDVTEEVLRLYGFDNLESKALNLPKTASHSKMFLLENYLRVKLFDLGYTEIFNYTFVAEGEVKLKAGLAEDKMFLRKNLEEGMKVAFTKNYNYLPIVESDTVKTFEIGSVFGEKGEFRNCVLTFDDNKKKTKFLPQIEEDIKSVLGALGLSNLEILNQNEKPALIEFSLNALLKEINEKNVEVPLLPINKDLQSVSYKPISPYPFIVRDVATWVPTSPGAPIKGGESAFEFDTMKQEILKLNLQNVEKVYMFDSFTKKLDDGSEKTSIAFRIIFQSSEKTLTDGEVESEMEKVNNYLKDNNFEIR